LSKRTTATSPFLEGASAQRSPLARVVVVDEDKQTCTMLERSLGLVGYSVSSFPKGEAFLADFAGRQIEESVDVVLVDLAPPATHGLELIGRLHREYPELAVCVISASANLALATQAMMNGAYDYILKPFQPETVLRTIERAAEIKRLRQRNRFLQQRLDANSRFKGYVGAAPAMREVVSLIANVAPSDASVLIYGESGTGKELLARSVHEQSRRSGNAFVDINCGALTESVLESELFGHKKGAFTGAVSNRRGLFEEASGGTLFLDEIGELTLSVQVRLLRVLQEEQVRPVGSSTSYQVDVRIVAATNRDLEKEVAAGRFREDLYYRLNVVMVRVPPLRERREDLPGLAQYLLERKCAEAGKAIEGFTGDAMERLLTSEWPGNIRELENVIERAVVLAQGRQITVDLLEGQKAGKRPAPAKAQTVQLQGTFAEARTAFEKAYLRGLLDSSEGNLSAAARIAGLDRSNLRRLLKRHGLD
jgi:DNA-binding NtrC family response regulator